MPSAFDFRLTGGGGGRVRGCGGGGGGGGVKRAGGFGASAQPLNASMHPNHPHTPITTHQPKHPYTILYKRF